MRLKIITICLILSELTSYSQELLLEAPSFKIEKSFGKKDSNRKKTGEWLYYRKDQSLVVKILFENGKFNGFLKYYWENGNLYNSVNYVKGKKEGVDKTYFKDGSIAAVMSFKDGLKNGEHKEYRSDGSVNSIKNYKNDVLHGSFVDFYRGEIFENGNYENGKKHGKWLNYSQGEVLLESEYNGGVPNGIWKKHFTRSGAREESLELKDQIEYEYEVYNGVVINPIKIYDYVNIDNKYVDKNDRLWKLEKQYWQGNINIKTADIEKPEAFNKTGEWKKQNMNGEFRGKAEYKNGVEIFKSNFWPNGNKKTEDRIKDGIYYFEHYWPNGILWTKGTNYNDSSGESIEIEGNSQDGEMPWKQNKNLYTKFFNNGEKKEVVEQTDWYIKHGGYVKYYKNTKVEIRGSYQNNQKSGTWKYYDEQGNLIKTENYSNGIKQ